MYNFSGENERKSGFSPLFAAMPQLEVGGFKEMLDIRAINLRYRMMMSTFYGISCCAFNYITYCLGEAGYADKVIGFIVAAACLTVSIMQPIMGRLADRYPAFVWKRQVLIYSALELTAAVLAIIFSQNAAVGVLYGVMLFLSFIMMPMVCSAGFYYSARGFDVNFGIARGCGSIFYAAVSFTLGMLTVRFGALTVPAANIFLSAAVFVLALGFPLFSDKTENSALKTVNRNDSRPFAVKYPVFIMMVAGILLFLFFHNMVQTYFIRVIENVGGNSRDLGIAGAIAATVELPILFCFDRLQRRIEAKWLLVIAGAAFTLKGILFMLCTNVIGIYAVQLLQVFSFALFAGAGVYYSNQVMAKEDKVTGQALISMTEALSSVLGSFVGGLLIDAGGVPSLLRFATVMAVLGMAVCAMAAKLTAKRL